MLGTTSAPQVEDLLSVKSRVSWSAILAGVAISLAFQVLLGSIGATIRWTGNPPANAHDFVAGAAIWTILISCVSLFAGGVVTTVLTAGENKVEAAIYGVVMWAAFVGIVAHGATAGRNYFLKETAMSHSVSSSQDWETSAKNAGVPAAQIEEWRNKATKTSAETPQETSTRPLWYGLMGIWLSLFAGVAGALVGAGPTFRLVPVSRLH